MEPHRRPLREIFEVMGKRLGQVVTDLGRDTAGDSTALHARAKSPVKAVQAETIEGLPQPTAGRKEYTDPDGNITGVRRFHAMIGAVRVVHLAFATLLAASPRREGTLGKRRLGRIQKALQLFCRA